MSLLPYLLGTLDTVLLLALLVLLLRTPFHRHTTFTIYILVQFAAELAGWVAYYRFGSKSVAYRTVFWADQVALDLLLFLVVIAFAYEALEDNPLRQKAGKVFGVVFSVAVILPFALPVSGGRFNNDWFNHASQIWNFGAAIMNLVLWAALLSSRRRDAQLVTLSIGVGLATASAALAWGARLWLAQSHRWPVDSFMAVTHMVSLLVWCWAFRPHSANRPGAKPPAEAASQKAISTPS